MSSEQDDIDAAADAQRDNFGGDRRWPDPGDPPEDATAAIRGRYATVGYLVDALRRYASEYYSSNTDYMNGYHAGMRKAAGMLVNWLKGRGLWDR